MIRKVVVNNFKKFEQQEFDIPDHLVIAGAEQFRQDVTFTGHRYMVGNRLSMVGK